MKLSETLRTSGRGSFPDLPLFVLLRRGRGWRSRRFFLRRDFEKLPHLLLSLPPVYFEAAEELFSLPHRFIDGLA